VGVCVCVCVYIYICVCIYMCVCVCVCGLSYPALKVHAMCYIVIRGLPGFSVSCKLFHKRKDFRKNKVIKHNTRVLIFSTTFF